jgi:phosphoglycerate kinase
MEKLNVKDCDFKNKRVIMRVDFNVPLDKKLDIADDIRIKSSIPTIKYILEQNPKKIILMSHLGRPDGKVKEELRLNPVAKKLQQLLGQNVLKLNDCIGKEVETKINLFSEKVILLENLRFHAEEEKNDDNFAKSLAKLADIYVSDAFGTVHRAHASTVGVTKYLTSVTGFLLEKEINYLGKVL